jgi:signal transduction histidine kinase
LVKAQEEERQRIANDIHDDSIQIMTAVGLRLAALRGQAGDQAAEETLRTAEETVSLAIRRLRRLLFDLHPLSLDQSGLSAALEDLARLLGEDAGPRYSLDVELAEEPPPESRTILYRLAAEALANARKYSGAELVSVRIRAHAGGVRMTVSDDGVGFDPAVSWAPGHLGLATMHERAQLAGGYCRVDSARGNGTTVTCWIPTVPTSAARDAPGGVPGVPATRA